MSQSESPALPATTARTIEARERAMWDAYMRGDIATHNEILSDDYYAVFPEGKIHNRKPTREEIVATPIAGYTFSDFKVLELSAGSALVTYIAEVTVPSPAGTMPPKVKFAVTEVWVRQADAWRCRHYQGTFVE